MPAHLYRLTHKHLAMINWIAYITGAEGRSFATVDQIRAHERKACAASGEEIVLGPRTIGRLSEGLSNNGIIERVGPKRYKLTELGFAVIEKGLTCVPKRGE